MWPGGRPNIRFVADALILFRTGLDSQPLVFDAPFPAGDPILDASDLGLGEIGAARFDLTFFDGGPGPIDYQFGYLQTERATTQETRSSSPADVSFFSGSDAEPSDRYTVEYETKLSSFEFNLKHPVHPNVALSAGLRWADLRENFNFIASTEPVSGFYSDTKNELFGFQLGSDLLLWTDGFFRIEGTVKGGVYNNDINVYAKTLHIERGFDEEHTAFLGEANVGLVIPAWPFNFRIGYQFLILSGVALAPEQNDSLDLFDGSGGIDLGTPTYHGVLIGLEFVH
jgi:hypothetical protein